MKDFGARIVTISCLAQKRFFVRSPTTSFSSFADCKVFIRAYCTAVIIFLFVIVFVFDLNAAHFVIIITADGAVILVADTTSNPTNRDALPCLIHHLKCYYMYNETLLNQFLFTLLMWLITLPSNIDLASDENPQIVNKSFSKTVQKQDSDAGIFHNYRNLPYLLIL